ncbi:MAG: phosphoenolpyruvate--protein phosphotransferase [Actinobacteria bacterium]|nr:MAG: phosphoenolpyruvate--protein phosphotransferase [Actinomycetota bacterium]
MSEREIGGLAASPGVAVGRVLLLDVSTGEDTPHRGAEIETVAALAALDAVAGELGARAERLRTDGLKAEAEILDANRLMALDPMLRADVEALAREETATTALRSATGSHSERLAALSDPMLAARASDVRELGRRAARRLVQHATEIAPDGPAVLVGDDIGPADVADLRESELAVVAIALAAGAATSHAAIMARSLGLPMVVDAGPELLDAVTATEIVVDGDTGRAFLEPTVERHEWGLARMAELARERQRHARERALPAVTLDGRWVTLLANAAAPVEVRAALEMEADGIGLLRTELAFLDARAWPTEEEHIVALEPLLALLPGLVATVRVLDFGDDKTPPFLAGVETRGIALLLEHPDALDAQLRAILRAAGDADLRLLLPLVESPEQLRAVRRLLRDAASDTGWTAAPPLGAMIETPLAARRAHELALEADFFSVGTNDLVQYTLGLDRSQPLATARSAADPRVLRLIADTVAAGHEAGLTVEICGESASVPELAILYVGLGVDELSVAPARLDEIRTTVRSVSAEHATDLAWSLLSGEGGNQHGKLVGGLGGVVA